jgi:hypothetical protein
MNSIFIRDPDDDLYSNLSIGSNTSIGSYTTGAVNTSSSGIMTSTFNGTSFGSSASVYIGNSGTISLWGENADIKIDGKSMKTWMEKVDARLALLAPNSKLEKEWQELKELGDRYRNLEKEIQEKVKVWEILKNQDEITEC